MNNTDTPESKITVNTEIDGHRIKQELETPLGKVSEQIIDTQEEHIRKSLIKLGWTPPEPTPPTESVEGQNKSGIPEYDELVMGYQAGDITFNTLCSRLWNTGIKYGKQEATHPTPESEGHLSELQGQIHGLAREIEDAIEAQRQEELPVPDWLKGQLHAYNTAARKIREMMP